MIVVQTPLRISFQGGGTDFEDFYRNSPGAVLSTAIDKYVYVIVKERFDDLVYVNYSRKEIVDDIAKLEHDLVREAMRSTGVDKGVEVTTLADVPSEGSGLGSSSSITVALLHALATYLGEMKTAETLAKEACHIEIDILGRPIGRQDQYIAAYGNLRLFVFGNGRVLEEKVDLNKETKRRLNDNLMLFYTGITRRAETILTEQRANIGARQESMRQMARLAHQAREMLLSNALDEFGELLHQGWTLKKQLASTISSPYIDEMYEAARKAGALGGKITGAGGGGFLLLYCPPGKQESVRQALSRLRELPIRLESDGSKVVFNYRRS